MLTWSGEPDRSTSSTLKLPLLTMPTVTSAPFSQPSASCSIAPRRGGAIWPSWLCSVISRLSASSPRFSVSEREIRRGLTLSDRRSEEHTSELQSLMRISYAVFCLKKKKKNTEKYEEQQNDKKQ